jgi:hypothetical protein
VARWAAGVSTLGEIRILGEAEEIAEKLRSRLEIRLPDPERKKVPTGIHVEGDPSLSEPDRHGPELGRAPPKHQDRGARSFDGWRRWRAREALIVVLERPPAIGTALDLRTVFRVAFQAIADAHNAFYRD